MVNGQAVYCLSVGGAQIDQAITAAVLAQAAVGTVLAAADARAADHDRDLDRWRRHVERARDEAAQAERRYLASDPDDRSAARGLEAEWETKLMAVTSAESGLTRRQTARRGTLSHNERAALSALGSDVNKAWSAPTSNDRKRKELLRTLLEDVRVDMRQDQCVGLTLRWRGGAVTELRLQLLATKPPLVHTYEDTGAPCGRLAARYP